MPSKFSHRESGIVLLAALMVVMMLFASITVVLNFSVSESSVLEDRVDELEAFYLAEAALAAAKHEIDSGVDVGPAGLGSISGSKGTGDYTVTATEVGGVYTLTATGTSSSGSTVVLESTVELTAGTATYDTAPLFFLGGGLLVPTLTASVNRRGGLVLSWGTII